MPVLGRLLSSRVGRRVMQSVVLVIAVVMILDGFLGPRLAPRNLATVLGWVHYRGLLVLVLLVAGNFFCMTCPFTLSRDLARRFFRPFLNWPHWLRSKWVALVLFVAILFSYELFDLWGDPRWTAALILAYFIGAVVVDSVFRNASFCKYVCPIGQFNFLTSTVSPLEVRVRDLDVCHTCTTLDCIRGRRDPVEPEIVLQRGCELALFQPKKVGNLDCTFCMDCVQACPHDNVGLIGRVPALELTTDERRSGIGRLSRRGDYSVLALVFTFGALLNAFAMVSPVYVAEQWLADLLGTQREWPVLATLFTFALVLEPAILVGGTAEITRARTGRMAGLWETVRAFSFGLVPLGVGIWAAHYAFHLLTGLWTWIPAVLRLVSDLRGGTAAAIGIAPGIPDGLVYPIELGLIGLGLVGSLIALHGIGSRTYPRRALSAALPWMVLCVLLASAAVWLLAQPMEMRGTFLGG
ncbi:MAG TPA: hypothetical protein VF190_12475 [Rhodothermales bacterium]